MLQVDAAGNMRMLQVGATVGYESASRGLVRAVVVKGPNMDGTWDLDVKKSVPLSRIQVNSPQFAAEQSPYRPPMTQDAGSVSQTSSSQRPPGTICFYKSGTRGWIPAKVVRYCPQSGGYDLDCKGQAPLESIFWIEADAVVEYHSASQNRWMTARVLRSGKTPGTFDLDCREAAEVQRMRPTTTGGVPATLQAMPGMLCYSESQNSQSQSQSSSAPPLSQSHSQSALNLSHSQSNSAMPSYQMHSSSAPPQSQSHMQSPYSLSQPQSNSAMPSYQMQPPAAYPQYQPSVQNPPTMSEDNEIRYETHNSDIRLRPRSKTPEPRRRPSKEEIQTEEYVKNDLAEAIRQGNPQALQAAIANANRLGIHTGPELSHAINVLHSMGGRLTKSPSQDALTVPPVHGGNHVQPPHTFQPTETKDRLGARGNAVQHIKQGMEAAQHRDREEPGLLTNMLGPKPTEDAGVLTRILGQKPSEDAGLLTRVLGPKPNNEAGFLERVFGTDPGRGRSTDQSAPGEAHAPLSHGSELPPTDPSLQAQHQAPWKPAVAKASVEAPYKPAGTPSSNYGPDGSILGHGGYSAPSSQPGKIASYALDMPAPPTNPQIHNVTAAFGAPSSALNSSGALQHSYGMPEHDADQFSTSYGGHAPDRLYKPTALSTGYGGGPPPSYGSDGPPTNPQLQQPNIYSGYGGHFASSAGPSPSYGSDGPPTNPQLRQPHLWESQREVPPTVFEDAPPTNPQLGRARIS